MEEKKLITNDHSSKLAPTDQEILNSVKSGEGLIEIKSAEQLSELAHIAHSTFQKFREKISKIMTPERAAVVRRMRVDGDYSWRKIALDCFDQFDGDWQPSSNQLAGMALCEAAAQHFGEHYMEEPWN